MAGSSDTENFSLREWLVTDIPSLARHANNYMISKYMMDVFPHPYSEKDAGNFIAFATKDKPARFFAIVAEGEACGGIGLHPQTDVYRMNMEMGYWLSENLWKKGIATAAVKQMVAYGFKNFDIDRIFARPFGNNPASRRVLEKAGFTLEAKFEKTLIKNGERLDELIFAVRK
jgi:ribosomal-protein-alanine N-acetyltransferase